MARSTSPSVWVQLGQALIARELVEGFGFPERRAAARLGLAPSAISQYRSGKRLRVPLQEIASREDVRRVARRTAQELATLPESEVPAGRRLLEVALELSSLVERIRGPRLPASRRTGVSPAAVQALLHKRIAGEQAAVADCMRLAQKSRDELTRAVFRQIASDSLRHAEIVASLGTYLDRGVDRTVASGITRADVDRLVAREHAAESGEDSAIGSSLGGVMGLLWASMEADERKHEALLEQLGSEEVLGADLPRARLRARDPRRPRV